MFTKAARAAAVGAIVTLMTGCIKLDMDLSVTPDNKVNGTVIFAFSKQLLTLTGQTADQVLQESGGGVPASGAPGTTTSAYEDDTFAGREVTFDDVDLSEINEGSDGESLKIERSGDEFHVSGALDLTDTNADTSSGENPFGDAAARALETAEMRVKITFPGPVSSSNGRIDGNSVTWEPKVGEKMPLTAVASAIDSGGDFPLWVVASVAVVLVLAAGAIVMNRRRRRDATPPTSDAPTEDLPAAPAGPATP